MADITVTAAKVALLDPEKAVIKSYIASEAITKGQAVYIVASTGKIGLADANASGKYQFRGIALNGGGAGAAIDVVELGEVSGFTLGDDYDELAYVSNTAGALADTAGTTTIPAGRVVARTDKDLTKVLSVFVVRTADWS